MKRFPVLRDYGRSGYEDYPKSIAWSLIAPHEQQAHRNHDQTLKRLAERGGCGPDELVAILEDRRYRAMPMREAIDRLKELTMITDPLQLIMEERARQDEIRKGKPWERDNGDLYWLGILVEEVGETAAEIIEGNDTKTGVELVQVAAVALAWLEARARRG